MNWYNICKSKQTELNSTFYKNVDSINKTDWNLVLANKNIYLSLAYLGALETAMKDKVAFRYILFYNNASIPVAIAAVQILDFSNETIKNRTKFCIVGDKIKNKIVESLDIKLMICGNVFACGENGFLHTNDVTPEIAYNNLSNGLYKLRQAEKTENPISVVLLKEFWPKSFKNSDFLKSAGFKDFKVDVNMVLNIHNTWQNIDNYLASMTTKFRTKAKGVYKKSAEMVVKDLTKDEITQYSLVIEKLYLSVVEKAEFKFGVLNAEAFISFKENLKDEFIFKGYFLNDKMIGFSSSFICNNSVDANYVGIDYEYNYQYATYQRMLYDFVELAIHKKANELRLGRTAEEIKSCIGAEPTDMKLYLRHRNSISNHLLAPIISTITPSEFELRHPFKAEFLPI